MENLKTFYAFITLLVMGLWFHGAFYGLFRQELGWKKQMMKYAKNEKYLLAEKECI